MSEWGDGARAEIGIAFKDGSAHAFFAIQRNGNTEFIDAQGYSEDPANARDASAFFDLMATHGRLARAFNNFCRVDKLEFSDRAKLAFTKRDDV